MKIVIGGQMGKEEIKELAEGIVGDKGLVVIEDDIAAAMEIKQGTAELYLGACMTGGGGALAMAIAILGYPACQALTSDDENIIAEAAGRGIRVFGFTPAMSKAVVPLIIKHVLTDMQE